MSMGDAAMVIGRAVTGVLLCASGLAIYNEGIVPLIRKRRMLKQWPSEGDAEEEGVESEEAVLDNEEPSTVNTLNTRSVITENKVNIQQRNTKNEITKVYIPKQLEKPSGSTSQRSELPKTSSPTQKQLEARRKVWEQKSIAANNLNVKKETFEQTSASKEDSNGNTKVQRTQTRGVRLYDWSAKWKE